MIDWGTVLSVILGLFLFSVGRGLLTIGTQLLIARKIKVGEIDTTKPRGEFLG